MASKATTCLLRSRVSATLTKSCTSTTRRCLSTTTRLPTPLTSSSLRPRHTIPRHAFQPMPTYARRTLFIQTEPTLNPDSLKFLPGTPILPAGSASIEYLDGRETHNSPLARRLFQLDGISAVFYGPDFITVTKTPESSWTWVKPEVFALITEFLNDVGAGGVVVLGEGEGGMAEDTMIQDGDSEVVGMIKELLDTRIRPAIQEDGGDIEYRGFDEITGLVKLKLRGACRTCDSSTVTLKNGIESMLMHYVEEVKGVIQVLDQEEEIAIAEFERFEKNLAKIKGEEAVIGTGKGGLDSAPA